ncbi:MAG: hypothetical protein ACT4R6_12755 [Gemmatimonadaceae bacterium]
MRDPALLQAIAATVSEARARPSGHDLRSALHTLAQGATPEEVSQAAEHYSDEPDIAAPLLEVVAGVMPNDSRVLVRLANCYWLLGAGPEKVGELANRAIAADPAERGAWHLWALSESDPRSRVGRWQQVATRFPEDTLALANVADNAAAVAGAERDYEMVDVAIDAYEALRARARRDDELVAVDRALEVLRAWRF